MSLRDRRTRSAVAERKRTGAALAPAGTSLAGLNGASLTSSAIKSNGGHNHLKGGNGLDLFFAASATRWRRRKWGTISSGCMWRSDAVGDVAGEMAAQACVFSSDITPFGEWTREWVAVRKEDLCLIPDNIDDVSAAGIPVAYLTAQVALTRTGFRADKTVLAPAIGGSIGNAVTQLTHTLRHKSRHVKHDQSCESRAGEGGRIE